MIAAIMVAAVLAVAIVVLGTIAWRGSEQFIHPPHLTNRGHPRDYGLPFEDVSFPSRDGLTLRGWFIPAESPHGTIVFCHGHGGDRSPDVRYAPWFHERGYNVLMFDFRGHGESDDSAVSMGYFERRDLLGAIDYLARRGIDRVGVIGFSMGAVVAISTAPHSEAIRAVVADSGFARLRPAIARGAQERGIPAWLAEPLSYLVLWVAILRLRANLAEAEPLRWVAKIAPRPLLIIHGGRDWYIPVAEIERLYAAAGEPKELCLVPEAEHRQIDQHCPDEYKAKVLDFFDHWL